MSIEDLLWRQGPLPWIEFFSSSWWFMIGGSAHRNSEGECCRSAVFPNDSLPFAAVVRQHLIRNAWSSVRWSNELIFRVSGQWSCDAFWSPFHISQTRASLEIGQLEKHPAYVDQARKFIKSEWTINFENVNSIVSSTLWFNKPQFSQTQGRARCPILPRPILSVTKTLLCFTFAVHYMYKCFQLHTRDSISGLHCNWRDTDLSSWARRNCPVLEWWDRRYFDTCTHCSTCW